MTLAPGKVTLQGLPAQSYCGVAEDAHVTALCHCLSQTNADPAPPPINFNHPALCEKPQFKEEERRENRWKKAVLFPTLSPIEYRISW
jgi:hypothetical protein